MIIFDVDGTLIGGDNVDWQCFDDAFEEEAGFPFPSGFFDDLEEVTAKAIVHLALKDADAATKHQVERATQHNCFQRLQSAIEDRPHIFPAMPGALELWEDFRSQGHPFGIATGEPP